jgi:hypothetical protein
VRGRDYWKAPGAEKFLGGYSLFRSFAGSLFPRRIRQGVDDFTGICSDISERSSEHKFARENMARSLDKVHKKVAKKKGGKMDSLHVNSRDAKRLRAASAREEKLSRLMDAAARANQVYGMVVLLYRYMLYPDNSQLREWPGLKPHWRVLWVL